MNSILKFTALLLLGAMVTGCCACRSYQKNNRRPLLGTQWQLVQLNGAKITPSGETFSITLAAEGHRFSGVGACNRLMGSYEEGEKGALKIASIASTRMACEGMDRESAFIKALETTTHYDMDGALLMLLSDGEVKAVFQAAQTVTKN